MRIKKISALIAVPFIALSLSACGGNSNSNSEETTTNETTTSQEASPTEETSSPEETTPAENSSDDLNSTDSADSGGLSDNGDSAGKPTREEVAAGVKTVYEGRGGMSQFTEMGATDEQIDGFYGCVADNLYDNVSAQTLQTLAQGEPFPSDVSSEEDAAVDNALDTCVLQTIREIMNSQAG